MDESAQVAVLGVEFGQSLLFWVSPFVHLFFQVPEVPFYFFGSQLWVNIRKLTQTYLTDKS